MLKSLTRNRLNWSGPVCSRRAISIQPVSGLTLYSTCIAWLDLEEILLHYEFPYISSANNVEFLVYHFSFVFSVTSTLSAVYPLVPLCYIVFS